MPEAGQEVVVVQIDRHALDLPRGAIEAATARRMDSSVAGFPPLLALSEAVFAGPGGLDGTVGATIAHLMTMAMRSVTDQPFGWDRDDLLLDVLRRYMMDHLARPELDVRVMARENFVSERKVHALFAAEGDTPCRWIRRQRMTRACRLLTDSDLAVTAVGVHCGYPNPSVFSRTFRQSHGLTPSEYRAQNRST
ncbi:transcriptional regulator [Rhodococcus wratislaviensis IFP 2016]|uniref:Putative DNA-binding transcriptional dual regulator n=1 Tax=Rhodococcus opacus M213 TaxID=1129896 RepID=K8XPL6_RHOOP|nr:putative DNA-binding transcriptional dual regulator [Rhodococcus opacus M213]ELB93529.1 transcriptional regulator [Rhodococcus wratislaviensis IFP 2016]